MDVYRIVVVPVYLRDGEVDYSLPSGDHEKRATVLDSGSPVPPRCDGDPSVDTDVSGKDHLVAMVVGSH